MTSTHHFLIKVTYFRPGDPSCDRSGGADSMSKRKSVWRGMTFLPLMAALVIGVNIAHGEEAQVKESSCVRCHTDLGGKYAEPIRQLLESVHSEQEVACHDCHGGNPASFDEDEAHSTKKAFVGKPAFEEIPEFCARCHSDPNRMKRYKIRTDQLALYQTSHHGQLLYNEKDPNTATCTSCHGVHDVKSGGNPLSRVFKANIPKTCSECHSDSARMDKYKIPIDQYDQFVRSAHGKMLLEKGDSRAPTCSDCHGVHSATPPGYEDIAATCQMCHGAIAKLFKESPHYVEQTDEEAARCIDCHGDHNVSHATTALYDGDDEGHCGMCHESDSKQVRLAQLLKGRIEEGISEVEHAEAMLNRVRGSGKNLEKIEEAFEAAKSELVQARASTHTLSPERTNEHINLVIEEGEKVDLAAIGIVKELSGRRKGAIFVLAILAIIIVLVYIKIRTLKTAD